MRRHLRHLYRFRFPLAALAIVALAFFALPERGPGPAPAGTAGDLQVYADRVLAICRESGRPCYDEEIPKLMDEISMEDAFKVTALIQKVDDSYWYCHVLSHKLVAREVQKDPDNWKNILPRCPDDMCSNGCFHGTFQERFKREALTDAELEDFLPELATVCDPRPGQELTAHNHTSCHHGLGHLLMYLTNADILKSARACEKIGRKPSGDFVQTCTEGLFMQLYQPREEEDFALVKGKVPSAEEVSAYCDRFEGHVRATCHRESWVLYGDSIRNAPGIMRFCSWAEEGTRDHWQCLNKMFFSVLTTLDFDVDAMMEVCAGMPANHRPQCYRDTASRLITADKTLVPRAAEVCRDAAGEGMGDECWKALAGYANYIFLPDSPAAKEMCRMIPEEWRPLCLEPATSTQQYFPARHET